MKVTGGDDNESVVLSTAAGILQGCTQLHTLQPNTFQLYSVFFERTHVTMATTCSIHARLAWLLTI